MADILSRERWVNNGQFTVSGGRYNRKWREIPIIKLGLNDSNIESLCFKMLFIAISHSPIWFADNASTNDI